MTPARTVLWTAIAGAGLALAVTAVQATAAGNPVEARQATMKQVGLAMKDSAGYATGQTPWDAAKVKTLTDGIAANAKKLKALYPANTATDPKTSADPKVWQNKADFDKRLAEMGALATAAGKATSADAFKPAFLSLSGTCKSCHDLYRKKKA